MVKNFLMAATQQFVDSSGKTRMLNFPNDITLYTNPLPPTNIPISEKVNYTTTVNAQKFINDVGGIIRYQDGIPEQKIIQGLWFDVEEERDFYIPIRDDKEIEGVEYTPEALLPPLIFSKESELSSFRKQKRTALILQEYAFFALATKKGFSVEDVIRMDDKKLQNYLESLFVVKPGYNYEIEKLNNRIFKNDIMFSGDQLIASSSNLKYKLAEFLQTKITSSSKSLLEDFFQTYAEPKFLNDSSFISSTDFRTNQTGNQILFLDRFSLKKWNDSKKTFGINLISKELKIKEQQPYFYSNLFIFNSIPVMIQNVVGGTKENAIAVAKKWRHDKVNLGFDPIKYPSDVIANEKINIFYYDRDPKITFQNYNDAANLLQYPSGEYAAILSL